MDPKYLDAERDLRDLSDALGLDYEQQDWGIVNADARRLSEFIAYFEGHSTLSSTQRFELGELILASANEYLSNAEKSLPDHFGNFLRRNWRHFPSQLQYWRGLENEREFPVAAWLRTHLSEVSGE